MIWGYPHCRNPLVFTSPSSLGLTCSSPQGFRAPSQWIMCFGWCLAACAGAANVVAFKSWKLYASHVTGSTSNMAFQIERYHAGEMSLELCLVTVGFVEVNTLKKDRTWLWFSNIVYSNVLFDFRCLLGAIIFLLGRGLSLLCVSYCGTGWLKKDHLMGISTQVLLYRFPCFCLLQGGAPPVINGL
jgi:hypothetical protein